MILTVKKITLHFSNYKKQWLMGKYLAIVKEGEWRGKLSLYIAFIAFHDTHTFVVASFELPK